jgi:phage/plasmid-like protein (TIGR03299 family)
MQTKTGMKVIEGGSATVEEALRITNTNFEVMQEGIYNGDMKQIQGFKRVGISGGATFAITKDCYNIVQNKDAFSIADQIMGESQALIERVAWTGYGSRVMIQAKMPESSEVLKGDDLANYLTICTNHDGKGSVKAYFTSIRMACTNQMTMLNTKEFKASKRSVAIRHSANANKRIQVAGRLLMEGAKSWDIIRENAKIMADKSVTRQQTIDYINQMFPEPKKEEGKRSADHNKKKRDAIMELVDHGKGTEIAGVKGTAWGLFNAVTEYQDHYAPIREGDRYTRSFFYGEKTRQEAYDLAMSI